MRENLYAQLPIGLGITAVSAWVIYFSRDIEPAAAIFPRYISILLLVFGGILVIQNAINIFRQKPEITKSSVKAKLLPLFASLLCLLFIWIFPIVGFEISAFCLILFIMISISSRVTSLTILVSLMVPIILILIFRYGLNIRIPLALEMYF